MIVTGLYIIWEVTGVLERSTEVKVVFCCFCCDFEHFNFTTSVCVCACVCVTVCLSVCLSLASDSLAIIKVVIIKLGTMTASDMKMLHMGNYIDLDLHSRSHRS